MSVVKILREPSALLERVRALPAAKPLLERLPNLDVSLIDLSQPMLDRATERVRQATAGRITTIRGDIREVELPADKFIEGVLAVGPHPDDDQQ